jgi:MFS superfamily sulfate permease-like transporter
VLNEILQGKRLERYVPFVGWITSYQRAWLRDDAVSGIVVGLIMIPVAMAYAQMAGVPPQAGLYSAIVGMRHALCLASILI